MLNITDNALEQKIPAFFRLGFRPLFLSAALFSIFAIVLWTLILSGTSTATPYGGSFWWHAHEMIFGFVVAVIVGFLLTAVQTWTGINGVKGWRLAFLYGVWLAARILLFLNPVDIPKMFIVVLDLAFLPLAAYFLAVPIFKVKQHRNALFAPVLLLLTVCNGLTHMAVYTEQPFIQSSQHGFYAAVMFITLIMAVMGGRVIPFFTANATKIPRKPANKHIEFLSLASTWLIAFIFIFNLQTLEPLKLVVGVIALFAGVINLIRWSTWRFTTTVTIPLLWSLQLAYLFIPISFLLLGCHYVFGAFNLSSVIHGLTLGAMANMILAMMARVSLGHSGRPLKVHMLVPAAFMSLIVAAIVRFVGVNFFDSYVLESWQISAGLWVFSFVIFAIIYWPILTKPRVDGRPG